MKKYMKTVKLMDSAGSVCLHRGLRNTSVHTALCPTPCPHRGTKHTDSKKCTPICNQQGPEQATLDELRYELVPPGQLVPIMR